MYNFNLVTRVLSPLEVTLRARIRAQIVFFNVYCG